MQKPKLLQKRIIEKFCKKNPNWSINENQTSLTGEFAVRDYIAGLILMSKIIVIAQVSAMAPIYTLRKNQLQLKITATAKIPLITADFNFAEKVTQLSLSTSESRFRL